MHYVCTCYAQLILAFLPVITANSMGYTTKIHFLRTVAPHFLGKNHVQQRNPL
jgi:hypothetical protein